MTNLLASESQRAVEARGLSYRYPGATVGLEDVDLDVDTGSMLALIGPNGSGKTTLLRVLSGLVRARSGSLEVCGMNPSQADRRKFARRSRS
jgi:ABC-2 type transport system ATP-binding protein